MSELTQNSSTSKESFLVVFENMKRSYQQILKFKTHKSDGSNLEHQITLILNFFCLAIKLEKTLISSKKVNQDSITDFMTTTLPYGDFYDNVLNVCREFCEYSEKFRKTHVGRLRENAAKVARRTTRGEMIHPALRVEDLYYKEIEAELNEFGGAITIHFSNSRGVSLRLSELIWDDRNPQRKISYGTNLGGLPTNLLEFIEKCGKMWVMFLRKMSLLPEA